MNPILLIIFFLIAISVIAFILYKLDFRLDKLKFKLGLLEAETSREKPAANAAPASSAGPNIKQKADDGKIKSSGITVPSSSAVTVDQQAKNKGEINDSPIEIK